MDLTKMYITTPFAQYPKIFNDNFNNVNKYLDLFYDSSNGIIIVPVQTTGRIKGTKGEFNTIVVDNLIVRNQYTNLYDNNTSADVDYYNTYVQGSTTPRIANASTNENLKFKYIDVNKPYYKINNDVSLAFLSNNLGQEFQLLFDVSTIGRPFNILLDPSYNNNYKTLVISATDSSAVCMTLIAVEYDVSWGTTWAIKNYSGRYTIN